MRTEDGGASWTSQSSGTTADLLGLAARDRSSAILVGARGTIRGTTTAAWTQQPSQTNLTLRSVFFVDEDNGFVVGNGGTLLVTNNAGETWVPVNSGTHHDLWGMHFLNGAVG